MKHLNDAEDMEGAVSKQLQAIEALGFWVVRIFVAIVLAVVICLGILAVGAGCTRFSSDDVRRVVDLIPAPTPSPEKPDVPPFANWREVPVRGEFEPDPGKVFYQFHLQDGTIVRFRENHVGDFWGDYPSLGWGEIEYPDGRKRSVDINKLVRHNPNPSTGKVRTLKQHGKRLFWIAELPHEGRNKRVPIFEDGWNPDLEEAFITAKGPRLGLDSPLIKTEVKVESYQ